MANVIKTVLTYQLDGSTRDFNIPFEYLARKFVVVTLIGMDRKVLTINTDYRFATRTTISLTKAWGLADGYNVIELRRVTSTTDRLVDFTDGSILRAYDLNVAQIQTMHVAEEARDLTADTIGVNNDGNLDARGSRIVNIADGIEAGDAVTVGQMDRWTDSAASSAKKAKVSETNSKTSEINSKTSEVNSKASELLAQKWAENPRNDSVISGKFSALHWAENSKDYAVAANSSQASASQSATESAASAEDSKSEADRAAGEADRAAGEADRAAGEADRAAVEAEKLVDFNTLTDIINSVAVAQVGDIEPHVSRVVAKPGTVYADGQLLSRSVYPSLWAKVNAGEVPVVDEAVWQSTPGKRGCYTKGTDGTNFRVPDYNGVSVGSIKAPVLRGDGGLTAGDIQISGVPNLTGNIALKETASEAAKSNGVFGKPTSISNPTNSQGHSSGGGALLPFNARNISPVYQDGLTEARMNSVVICWVIRTHGVVNNPGSVDAAVLASRVEQVYTELLTRMVANENRAMEGARYSRNVYSNVNGFTTTNPAVCSEDIRGKLIEIKAFQNGSTGELYYCQAFRVPDEIYSVQPHRMYIELGGWSWQLQLTAPNTLTMVYAGSGTKAISYINVISDYPQT